jgi:hypothetical protein
MDDAALFKTPRALADGLMPASQKPSAGLAEKKSSSNGGLTPQR